MTQQALIEKLMRRHSPNLILYPGEYGYQALAARLIVKEINSWFQENGINQTIEFYAARTWIIRSYCPPWVIIGLSQRLNLK